MRCSLTRPGWRRASQRGARSNKFWWVVARREPCWPPNRRGLKHSGPSWGRCGGWKVGGGGGVGNKGVADGGVNATFVVRMHHHAD